VGQKFRLGIGGRISVRHKLYNDITHHKEPARSLRHHPLFQDVIDALENIQSELGLRERKMARHQVERYMIENGKL
jgi:hypothetical protein